MPFEMLFAVPFRLPKDSWWTTACSTLGPMELATVGSSDFERFSSGKRHNGTVLCASSDVEDSPKTLMIWTSAAQPLGDPSLRPDKRPELPCASSLISFSVPYLPYSFAFFC